jgi:hypothetical protein
MTFDKNNANKSANSLFHLPAITSSESLANNVASSQPIIQQEMNLIDRLNAVRLKNTQESKLNKIRRMVQSNLDDKSRKDYRPEHFQKRFPEDLRAEFLSDLPLGKESMHEATNRSTVNLSKNTSEVGVMSIHNRSKSSFATLEERNKTQTNTTATKIQQSDDTNNKENLLQVPSDDRSAVATRHSTTLHRKSRSKSVAPPEISLYYNSQEQNIPQIVETQTEEVITITDEMTQRKRSSKRSLDLVFQNDENNNAKKSDKNTTTPLTTAQKETKENLIQKVNNYTKLIEQLTSSDDDIPTSIKAKESKRKSRLSESTKSTSKNSQLVNQMKQCSVLVNEEPEMEEYIRRSIGNYFKFLLFRCFLLI